MKTLIKTFCLWINSFMNRRKQAEHTRGFTYAVCEILQSTCAESTLSRLRSEADDPFDHTPFDVGILDAIHSIESWNNEHRSIKL